MFCGGASIVQANSGTLAVQPPLILHATRRNYTAYKAAGGKPTESGSAQRDTLSHPTWVNTEWSLHSESMAGTKIHLSEWRWWSSELEGGPLQGQPQGLWCWWSCWQSSPHWYRLWPHSCTWRRAASHLCNWKSQHQSWKDRAPHFSAACKLDDAIRLFWRDPISTLGGFTDTWYFRWTEAIRRCLPGLTPLQELQVWPAEFQAWTLYSHCIHGCRPVSLYINVFLSVLDSMKTIFSSAWIVWFPQAFSPVASAESLHSELSFRWV